MIYNIMNKKEKYFNEAKGINLLPSIKSDSNLAKATKQVVSFSKFNGENPIKFTKDITVDIVNPKNPGVKKQKVYKQGTLITKYDDLILAIKNQAISEETMGQITTGILKQQKIPVSINELSALTDDFVTSDAFLKKYSNLSIDDLKKELKNRKYSQQGIDAIEASMSKPNYQQLLKNKKINIPSILSGVGNGITSKLTDALVKAGKIKTGVKILKYAIGAGAVGGLVAYLSNGTKIQLNSKYSEEVKNLLNPCLRPLLSNGGEIAIVSDGAQLILKKTGDPEDDSKGGVVYYPNGRVWTMDKSKKGNWSCDNIVEENLNETMKPKTLKEAIRFRLKNLLNEEIDKIQLAQDVDKMVDLLDMYSSAQDLKDAFDLLTKYSTETINGQNAGKVFLQKYRSAGLGGFVGLDTSVSDSVSNIIAINSLTKQYKEDLLNLVKSIETGKVNPKASGKSSNGVKIIWDKDSLSKTTTSTQPKQKIKYKLKNDFPYLYGDKSDVIKKVQEKIGLEPRYITGNFGPITLKRLTEMGFDMTNGITPEIYKQIMGISNSEPSATETKPTETKSNDTFDNNPRPNFIGPPTEDETYGRTDSTTNQNTTTATATNNEPKEEQPNNAIRDYLSRFINKNILGNIIYNGAILDDNQNLFLDNYIKERFGNQYNREKNTERIGKNRQRTVFKK